jgi:hypothetical protein
MSILIAVLAAIQKRNQNSSIHNHLNTNNHDNFKEMAAFNPAFGKCGSI